MSKRRNGKLERKLEARIADYEKTAKTSKLGDNAYTKPGSRKHWKSV